MKDPSYALLSAVFTAGVSATATKANAYEFTVPETGGHMPYVVFEGVIAVPHRAKDQHGSEWILQARVVTPLVDKRGPSVIGDLLSEALVPSTLDLSGDGFKVVHSLHDSTVPTRQVQEGKDRWAETLYRYRYTLQEL